MNIYIVLFPRKISSYQDTTRISGVCLLVEKQSNCGKEAGTRTECFCQRWENLVLSLKQPKGCSKNQSWCRVQVIRPIYLAWKLFLSLCSMFSWHIRELSFTRPRVKSRPYLSSNSMQSQKYTSSQIKPTFSSWPIRVNKKFSMHTQVLLHGTVFQVSTYWNLIHIFLLIFLVNL